MSAKIRFSTASVTSLVLAKIGNPLREEALQTSRELYRVSDDDREILTGLFLKPFKNLAAHRFYHHSSLEHHEMNLLSAAIFSAPSSLHTKGCEMARRLYSKSNHPNIKSGDLCISLVDDIEVDGKLVQAICILKSESVVPFLSISAEDGDLKLHTEQGINPEKIDKGCLIFNHLPRNGYYVLTFDRSGGESRFWVREFLGLQAIPDSAFLTNTFANIAVNAVKHNLDDTILPEQSSAAAREVIAYFDDREHFDLQEFEEKVLKTPDAVARFADQRVKAETEHGEPLKTNFEISPKDVKKVKKHAAAVMKLDTGVEIHLKASEQEPVLERGYDDAKGMKYIKVFYNEDITHGQA
ncbi:MAG: nucleoid-associated protein [Verrucomicrobiales bacterium]|nr:nucleoid-associated protein [Verrucomicrobiales bacterium]MCP5556943.1 nucleoid-associated protein [Verrucomicrobiaceae bacterium]